MIITESFVWINYPKTGSTFVRECLRKLYQTPWIDLPKVLRMRGRFLEELKVPETRPGVGGREGKPTPHGRVSQIPTEHKNKPILSSIRGPVERLKSLYAYGDWRKLDQLPRVTSVILDKYPSFPNFDFTEFLAYRADLYQGSLITVGQASYNIGPQSADFLRFFSTLSPGLGENFNFRSWQDLRAQLGQTTFLHIDCLNQDLFNALISFGFKECDAGFVRDKPVVNKSQDCKIDGVPSETIVQIESSEWLLGAACESVRTEGRMSARLLETRAAPHKIVSR